MVHKLPSTEGTKTCRRNGTCTLFTAVRQKESWSCVCYGGIDRDGGTTLHSCNFTFSTHWIGGWVQSQSGARTLLLLAIKPCTIHHTAKSLYWLNYHSFPLPYWHLCDKLCVLTVHTPKCVIWHARGSNAMPVKHVTGDWWKCARRAMWTACTSKTAVISERFLRVDQTICEPMKIKTTSCKEELGARKWAVLLTVLAACLKLYYQKKC